MEQKEKPFVFEMTEVESERVREFTKQHIGCPCRVQEHFSVSFIPTMMGHLVFVKCLACGKKEDVTEMEKF